MNMEISDRRQKQLNQKKIKRRNSWRHEIHNGNNKWNDRLVKVEKYKCINERKYKPLEVGQVVSNADVCDARYFIDSLHETAVSNRKMVLCMPREKGLKLSISMRCWVNSNSSGVKNEK